MKTKTGIVIQARMSSTRLPGKVMLPLAGRPILWHVIERCKRSGLADEVIVATTTDALDEKTAAFCQQNDYAFSRGPLEDVLARYHEAAKQFNLETIVRVTSDCPLVDPTVIDESIKLLDDHRASGVEYVSNTLDRIFPRGLDCETFTLRLLTEASEMTTTPEEREHVTVYMRQHAKTLAHRVGPEYQGDFRLTVDEPTDYELLDKIYERFYREGEIIDVREVIKYLKSNPKIAAINAGVEQKKVSI